MGFFKKKPDPLEDRSKALNAKIAALEQEIKGLETGGSRKTPPKPERAAAREPVFETISVPPPGPAQPPTEADRAYYNDLGARKYDLLGMLRRLKTLFKGPGTSNPKLVSYLAAGSIKGLRPLRYEKRVARNRFIVISIIFLLLLWGMLAVIFKQR